MSVLFICRNCDKVYDPDEAENTDDTSDGKSCPKCHEPCNEVADGDEYITVCPLCGKDARLVACNVSCSVPIHPDGWNLMDSPSMATGDEVFDCSGKCGQIPADYIFGRLSKKEAVALMRADKSGTLRD